MAFSGEQCNNLEMRINSEKLLFILVAILRRFAITKGMSVCGGLLDHGPLQSGVITSPNYPHAYDNETFCIWLLRAHDGGSVRLHIHYLEGQATREGHCVDFMEVRAGSADSELLFSGCSSSTSQVTNVAHRNSTTQRVNAVDNPTDNRVYDAAIVVDSPNRWMWILFTSDEEVSNTGFTATWTFISNITKTQRNPIKACDNTHFQCDNLECISYSWVCDGYPDCGCHKGCDEHHCYHSNLPSQIRLSIGLLIGLSVFIFISTMATYCELRHPWPPFSRDRRIGYDTDIKIVQKDAVEANNPTYSNTRF